MALLNYNDLENGEYRIKLTDNANEYPESDDWLIRIVTDTYGGVHRGRWIHVDKQGNRVGNWSEDVFKTYSNIFVLNVKDGTIVEQYTHIMKYSSETKYLK
ncbi:MAG: hypothetical protein LBL90_00335 [Prevotellaceae bacterium]|nr:hypothetical protein [Prevotellaceae bacterium]